MHAACGKHAACGRQHVARVCVPLELIYAYTCVCGGVCVCVCVGVCVCGCVCLLELVVVELSEDDVEEVVHRERERRVALDVPK